MKLYEVLQDCIKETDDSINLLDLALKCDSISQEEMKSLIVVIKDRCSLLYDGLHDIEIENKEVTYNE